MHILKENISKIHTTILGKKRIQDNLNLHENVIEYCQKAIIESNDIKRIGKNYYVNYLDGIITINAYSFTIITAHKNR